MSDLYLAIFLTFACVLAVTYATPRQMQALKSVGITLPISVSGAMAQGVFLSVVGVVFGVLFSDRAGLTFVTPQAVGESGGVLAFLSGLLLPTTLITLIAFIGHLIIYYLVFRPRLPANDVITGERIRIRMGILARVLQGGVVEEVQFRWGVVSVAVWLGSLLFPGRGDLIVWSGITAAALVFSLFHLVGAVQIGIGNSSAGVGMTVIDNGWVGIAFGWLFWQHGLLAAILSHALIHVLWFPIEVFFLDRYIANKNAV